MNYLDIYEKYEFNLSKLKEELGIDKLKVFDSFCGIGALHQAFKELGFPIELIGTSEIDIDAIISYTIGHVEGYLESENTFNYPSEPEMREYLMSINVGWDFKKEKSSIPRLKKDKLYKCYRACIMINNLGDISILDPNEIEDFDMFNFSFPCTNISVSGKQEGFEDENGKITSSGLYVYGINIIKAKKPKFIMIENVKNLIQKKFINDFYDIVKEIEELGYKCYYPMKKDKPTCLNAKDYGIPQNRERIFVICIRNDIHINLEFPEGFDNGLRLKDMLEDEVDDKFYLSQEIQNRFKRNDVEDKENNNINTVGTTAPEFRTIGQRDIVYGTNGIMSTLVATDYKQPKQILDQETYKQKRIGGLFDTEKQRRQAGSIWDKEYLSPTIDTAQGGYRMPCITEEELPKVCEQRKDEGLRFFKDDVCGTLRTIDSCGDKRIIELDYKIRKLTPTECWRLMGFRDEFIDKCIDYGISNSALYKQAGNSIVVTVLYCIFRELFKDYIVK